MPTRGSSGYRVLEKSVPPITEQETNEWESYPDEPEVVVTRVRPRNGPALAVLGCVALVVVGGFTIALLGSGKHQAGGASLGKLQGVSFAARSAQPVVERIAVSGDPPSDVAKSLVIPDGSTVSSAPKPPPAVNLYSGTFKLNITHSASSVVNFYKHGLVHDHWSLLAVDATASGNGTQIFARYASEDGFYWEVGIVVNPVTASITPALGGATDDPTSTAALTLFEIDDAD